METMAKIPRDRWKSESPVKHEERKKDGEIFHPRGCGNRSPRKNRQKMTASIGKKLLDEAVLPDFLMFELSTEGDGQIAQAARQFSVIPYVKYIENGK